MLRLTQQVCRADFCINGFIGNHHGLGRTGKEVDANTTKQLSLGFGNKGVSGANQHVHRLNGFGSQCHRTDRLDSAQNVNLVSAAKVHGRDYARIGFAVEGRGARDDPRHTSNARRRHRHVRGSYHRELTARHVAPYGLHWDVLVTEDDARHGFNFDVGHAVALSLRKNAHLLLRKLDVVQLLRGQLRDQIIDLGLRQSERFGRVAIKLFR